MPSAHRPGDDLGEVFLRVSRLVRRHLSSVLGPWGLSPHQARALAVVARHEPVRPGVIAGHLRIAPRSVTDVLDALADQSLVQREADPEDRRALVIRLTARGSEVAAEIESARRAALATFFAALDPAERASLRGLLARLETELADNRAPIVSSDPGDFPSARGLGV